MSTLNIHWKDWCWKWSSNTLATWCEELTHWKRPWCWERLKAGGEGDDRGWDGWMASLTWWMWVWVNSGSWWWTGRPGMLQFMGSQSQTRLSNWTELNWKLPCMKIYKHAFLQTKHPCFTLDLGSLCPSSHWLQSPGPDLQRPWQSNREYIHLNYDNSKNTSRNFSGAVVGSVGSVQFQIVTWSGLYFSRSIGPFQCSRC